MRHVDSDVDSYRRRLADVSLDRLLGALPALMVVGPRGVGKTTTVSRRAASTVRLDIEAEAAAFAADPDAALRGLAEPVLLDEWQVVPGVLGAVKRAVDADPRPGRFILTGSVRAELERGAWPGTGRVVRVPVYPMTVRELEGRVEGAGLLDRILAGSELMTPPDPPDLRDYVELMLRSGLPFAALRLSGQGRREWLESYVGDLLTRDVDHLEHSKTRGRDVQRLRRYFEAYALNSAGTADHKTIYDAAQVTKVTATSYEDLLTRLLVVEQVPAWTSNRLKRLVLQPKRFVLDPALIAAAVGLDEAGVLRDGAVLGRMLESFVAAQLRPELELSTARARLYHLRTAQGRHESDLVVEVGGRLVAIEVKAGAPSARDARHLAWLRDELGERFVGGVVLHTGARPYTLGESVVAAPISTLWA